MPTLQMALRSFKTPKVEIERAMRLKTAYFQTKKKDNDGIQKYHEF